MPRVLCIQGPFYFSTHNMQSYPLLHRIRNPTIPLYHMAHITFWGRDLVDVFWSDNGPLVFYQVEDQWFVDDDCSVLKGVSKILRARPYHLVADEIVMFDFMNSNVDCPELSQSIYECSWKDFACDRLALQFNVRLCPWIRGETERPVQEDSCMMRWATLAARASIAHSHICQEHIFLCHGS